ncbi:GlsB/YeaQ/YmgE family stress response membrane protein [Candidatus Peregrinibacteria bacterium]|nr:GlsB/YeaQ/YmgE family stress response membrane protein [Candidatus Peregrinibacteria bacterium]
MEILLFLAIGLIAGWIAGEVAKDYGFSMPIEIVVGLVAALAGGYLIDYYGLNPYGLWGSASFALIAAAVVLFFTKFYHPVRRHW